MPTEREAVEELRDAAADKGDLSATLWFDDKLEDLGMHGDDRRTCHSCQSWADHTHDKLTGRRIDEQPAGELEEAKYLTGLDEALRRYVRSELTHGLINSGRRPEPSERTAELLTPVVVAMFDDPAVLSYVRIKQGYMLPESKQ